MKKKVDSSEKGQVTIFVILGIVILVVIVFGLFIASTVSKLSLQSQADKAVKAYLQSDAVNYYVYTCMDSAVTSAIYDLAIQGGVFYDYQNGSYKALGVGVTHVPYNISWIDSYGNVNYYFFNVSYSVLNNGYCNIVQQQSPEYPFDKSFVDNLFGIYNDYNVNGECIYDAKEGYALSGFAGFNNMTRLCMIGKGNTNPIKTEGQSVEFSPCQESISSAPNKSIDYILGREISVRIANCTDFSVFKDDNITVSGMPETKIIYTSESVLAETTYNLTVKIKNKEPVFVKYTFSYKSNLRLARLHNYVMSLIRAESQDFFFNINNNYESYGVHNELNPEKFYDKDYMNVTIINFTNCLTCPYRFDHLLIVEDKKSIVGNRPLVYMTMIQNRKPALDYIHLTPINSYYDIIVSNNQEITLEPQGYDPDDEERNITYFYEGWKETYDESCELIPNSVPNPPELLVNAACTKDASNMLPLPWTKSSLFISTKRMATYKTTESDKGPHEVTIRAKDISGLDDYQVVRILVFDLPQAIITLVKPYFDLIEEDKASIEDYLTLNGENSIASTILDGEVTRYDWTIIEENNPSPVFAKQTADKIIYVSGQNDLSNLDLLIQTIKPFELQNTGIYTLNLVVESTIDQLGGLTLFSLQDSKNIDVRECLPHRNSFDPPFPYNTGTNPFDADHACCTDTYEVVSISDNQVCYSNTQYGGLQSINAITDSELANPNGRFTNYNFLSFVSKINPVAGDSNDIYSMTFERFCDGNRGNICAGNMIKRVDLVESCGNKASVLEKETCSGPPSSTLSNVNVNCAQYAPGNSYETTFGVAGADGTCNTAYKCSNPGYSGYGALGGKMLCQAQCGGGACGYAANCQCAVGNCGAQCDSTAAHSSSWIGTMCSYNCNLGNSCTFLNQKELPCTSGNSYCYSSSGTYANYCYSAVVCDANTATSVIGEYCNAGVVPANSNICLWGSAGELSSDRCNSDGTCKLHESQKPICSGGTMPVCNINQGWICS